jgi:hypothetical protein
MESQQEATDVVEPGEKGHGGQPLSELPANAPHDNAAAAASHSSYITEHLGGYMKRFEQQLVEYNVEARGIQRVEEQERLTLTWIAYLQVFLLWMSINLAANNITLGMLGPTVYELSFLDASLCSVFGALVGALVAAWAATWGPISGNRTLVRQILS